MLSLIGIKTNDWKHAVRNPHQRQQYRLQHRLPLIFGLALIAQGFGNSIYSYNQWHFITIYPTWADFAMMLTYPPLMLGLLLLPMHQVLRETRMRIALDSLVIIAALVSFSWFFQLGPVLLHTKGQDVSLFTALAVCFTLFLISYWPVV